MTPSITAATVSLPDLEPAPPRVRRHERQKLFAQVASGAVSLAALALLAFAAGPLANSDAAKVMVCGPDRLLA
jgi:hypothetical protein